MLLFSNSDGFPAMAARGDLIRLLGMHGGFSFQTRCVPIG